MNNNLIYAIMAVEYELDYFELDQNNPTLQDLIAFTKRHGEYFHGVELTVLTEYEKTTREDWTNGRYYLYGQLPVFPDTPITSQMLNDANEIWKQRVNDSVDILSFEPSARLYAQLIDIIDIYRSAYMDIMYVPGTKTKYVR